MASIASMGLSHAIARGIYLGLWKKKGEFVRTAKSRRLSKKPNPFTAVTEELLMFIAIVLAIAGMLNLPGLLDHWLTGHARIARHAAPDRLSRRQALDRDTRGAGHSVLRRPDRRDRRGTRWRDDGLTRAAAKRGLACVDPRRHFTSP